MRPVEEGTGGPGPNDSGQEAASPGTAGAAREAVVDTGIEGDQVAAPAASGTQATTPEAQRDEYYDLLLRKTAEFDNYRKRVEREKRELSDHVVGEFVKELLPVLDDFTRALATPADSKAVEGFRSGVELIRRRFADLLAKHGVEVIDPVGQPFDPHVHEAVQRVPAEGARDGEVVEVYSLGYKLRDRLLRPAIVKVAIA